MKSIRYVTKCVFCLWFVDVGFVYATGRQVTQGVRGLLNSKLASKVVVTDAKSGTKR